MRSIHSLSKQAQQSLRRNSPGILTAVGVTGTVSTAYLAGKTSYDIGRTADAEFMAEPFKEKAKQTWRLYIPAVASGAATIFCIIGANRIGSRRTAAITAAYSISERAFSEYKEKVVEKIGEKKEQAIRDEIAQDRVRAQPSNVIVTGAGKVLCCELYTGRYFESDMETLRKAQNDVNARALRDNQATLGDFHHLVGLKQTCTSDDFGWIAGKIMELRFSTVLTEDNKPCLAFEYSYMNPM